MSWDLFDRPERVLLAISQAFDFRADSLPVNVRYVGPLLVIGAPVDLGQWRRDRTSPARGNFGESVKRTIGVEP
jgi:hypothetical protein